MLLRAEHHVIFVPGLQDRLPRHRRAVAFLPHIWRLCGAQTRVVVMDLGKSGGFAYAPRFLGFLANCEQKLAA